MSHTFHLSFPKLYVFCLVYPSVWNHSLSLSPHPHPFRSSLAHSVPTLASPVL
jgi:hypothetical protein